jgi:hypothetical protein
LLTSTARPDAGRGGLGRCGKWLLEFERTKPSIIEPVMSWIAGDDPIAPLQLYFSDLLSAVRFAEREGWPYEVHKPIKSTIKLTS